MLALRNALDRYRQCCETPSPGHTSQIAVVEQFEKLIESDAKYLDRKEWAGHLTGSALVTTPELDQVLLTLHAKLGTWLQLGGHADGDEDLAAVALRECKEESGLQNVEFFPLSDIYEDDPSPFPIFDLDIHWIPARPGEPGHNHYDVRYLLVADRRQPLVITPESRELKWIPLSDAYGLSTEWSMHRQFDKLSWIKRNRARA